VPSREVWTALPNGRRIRELVPLSELDPPPHNPEPDEPIELHPGVRTSGIYNPAVRLICEEKLREKAARALLYPKAKAAYLEQGYDKAEARRKGWRLADAAVNAAVKQRDKPLR
jgi:hypothetical protein